MLFRSLSDFRRTGSESAGEGAGDVRSESGGGRERKGTPADERVGEAEVGEAGAGEAFEEEEGGVAVRRR